MNISLHIMGPLNFTKRPTPRASEEPLKNQSSAPSLLIGRTSVGESKQKKNGAHVMCLGGSLNSPPRPEPAYVECSPETAGGERETEQSTESERRDTICGTNYQEYS